MERKLNILALELALDVTVEYDIGYHCGFAHPVDVWPLEILVEGQDILEVLSDKAFDAITEAACEKLAETYQEAA